MSARNYIYYDANNNKLTSPRDMQKWQWEKEMSKIPPVRCRGHHGMPYVSGVLTDDLCNPIGRVQAVRVVGYKNHSPSKHKCGAKCRGATGPNCECECGGKNHGVDA